MKKSLALIIVLCSCWLSALGATTVSIDGCSAGPGAQARLTLTLTDVDPGVTALEVAMDVPVDAIAYGGTASVDSRLGATHSVQAGIRDGKLHVAVYSLGLAPLSTGALASVDLSLLPEPGHYTLTATAVASKTDGTQVAATATSPVVHVIAPRLTISALDTDFGRVPIRSVHTRSFKLTNTGTETAQIAEATASSPELYFTNLPATLAPGSSVNLQLAYAPTVRAAAWNGKIAFTSNAVNSRVQVLVKAVPFSVNELRLDGVSGISGSEVSLPIRFNNMEPIVGMDLEIPLPEGLDYVEGSAQLAARAPHHSMTASYNSATRMLRLVMYNLSNMAVADNDGLIATVRLSVNARSGWYWLDPTAVLANADGENMTSAVYGEYVCVSAPQLSAATKLAMGAGSMTSPHRSTFSVSNYGNAPMMVDRVTFLSEGFRCNTALPLEVAPYSSGTLEIEHTQAVAGSASTTMNIYSNDPDRRLHQVQISASRYEPNALILSTLVGAEGQDCEVSLNIDNYSPISALQTDIEWSAGMTLTSADIVKSPRLSDHAIVLAPLGANKHRLVAYSPTNATINPGNGAVLTLRYRGNTDFNTPLTASNIVLSDKGGSNVCSPGSQSTSAFAEVIDVQQVVMSESSVVIGREQSWQLTATVVPADATYRSLTWTSSNEDVVTVDSNGLITAVSSGSAIITARSSSGVEGLTKVDVDLPDSVDGVSADCCPQQLYNLQGMPVSKPQAGIYLRADGKKLVIR